MTQSTDVTGRDLPPLGGRQSRRRLIAIAALGAAAFAIGVVIGAKSGQAPSRRVAARFTRAWERGDWPRMFALSRGARRPHSAAAYARRYRAAAATATATGVRFGRPGRERDGIVDVPATVTTRLWGPLRAT